MEWCSSLWLHVVQAVDPQCQRTVLISSKFDNRIKEFSERWEVPPAVGACMVAETHGTHAWSQAHADGRKRLRDGGCSANADELLADG